MGTYLSLPTARLGPEDLVFVISVAIEEADLLTSLKEDFLMLTGPPPIKRMPLLSLPQDGRKSEDTRNYKPLKCLLATK
jgi:hypothetical protein